MRTDFSGPMQAEMVKRSPSTGTPKEFFLTAVIHSKSGAGDLFLCDARHPNLTINGRAHRALVRKGGWGEIGAVEQRDAQTLDISIVEIDCINLVVPGFGRLSDYVMHQPEETEVEIFYNFRTSSGGIERAIAYTGIIQGQPTTRGQASLKLSLRALPEKYLNRQLIETIDAETYPRADPSAINQSIPIVLGSVARIPGNTIENIFYGPGDFGFDPKDPNSGKSKVIICENPRDTFGQPSVGNGRGTIQYNGVPIRSGDLGTGLSSGMDAYVNLLLTELRELNEITLSSRLNTDSAPTGGHSIRTVVVGQQSNGAEASIIIQPITIPSDLVNPTLKQVVVGMQQDLINTPSALTVRISEDPRPDFFGENDGFSLGDFSWPMTDTWRRNVFADEISNNRSQSAPLSSGDTPLTPGKTYYLKIDAVNTSDTGGTGNVLVPVYPLPTPEPGGRTEFNPGEVFDQEAYMSSNTAPFGIVKLGGGIYTSMSFRASGGASAYGKDQPLGDQSGTFVAIIELRDEGLLVRGMVAALRVGGNDATASIEIVGLNLGSTLGQSVLSFSFEKDDFTEDLEVVPNTTIGATTVSGTYFRVRKNCPLTVLPPGRYAVRFSGDTEAKLTRTIQGAPFQAPNPPISFLGMSQIGTAGPAHGTPITQRGSIGVYLTPPAVSSPSAPLPPSQTLTTSLGKQVHGAFDLIGARFHATAGFDGYSRVTLDNLGEGAGNLSQIGQLRETFFIEFDCGLPSGARVSADATQQAKSPALNVKHALKHAAVPSERIDDTRFAAADSGTSMVFNGLIDQPQTYKQIILKMCFEGHLAFDWSVAKASVRDLRVRGGIDFTITGADITATRKIKNVSITRGDISKVANVINLKYARDWSGGAINNGEAIPLLLQSIAPYRKLVRYVNAESLGRFKKLERPDLFKLDLVSDDASASEFGLYAIDYYGNPHDTAEVTLMTSALAVENDDYAAFSGV